MQTLKLSRIQWDIIFVLFLPLSYLIINPTWMWLNSTVDTWAYYGYFLNLNDYLNHLQDSPIAYFGSRLPLILVGNLFYQLFPNNIANYSLHLFYIYIAIYSIYFLTYIFFRSYNTSIFSSVLMCCNSYFLWAMGWDYVDGPIISYSLLLLLIITLAAKKRNACIFILAGSSLALLIYTNLFLVSFIPAFAFFLYSINRKYYMHNLVKIVLYVFAGFSLTTGFFCVINWILNGEFLFFMPSVQFTLNNIGISTHSNIWLQLSPQSYLIYSYWLNFPILIFLLSLFYVILLVRRNLLWDPFVFVSLMTYLIVFSIMLFWEIRAGNILTDYSSYFRFLYPELFLATSALSNHFLKAVQGKIFYFFIALIISFSYLFLMIPDSFNQHMVMPATLIVMITNSMVAFIPILILVSFTHLYKLKMSNLYLQLHFIIIGLFFSLMGVYLRYLKLYELSEIVSPPLYSDLYYIFNWLVLSYYPTILTISILVLIFVFHYRLSRKFILLLLSFNIGLNYTTLDLRLSFSLDSQKVDLRSSLTNGYPVGRQEIYSAFQKALAVIQYSRFNIDRLFFWYNTSGFWNDFNSNSINDIYRNISSPFISSGQIINEHYPVLNGVDLLGRGSILPNLSPGDVVVVLSQDTMQKNAVAIRSLLGLGLKTSIVYSNKVSTKHYNFNMNFFRVDIDEKLFNFSSRTDLANLKWNVIDTSKPEVINVSRGILVTTNRSQYDWQLSTDLIPALPNSTYLVEFDRNLIQGGMSFIVGGSPIESLGYQNNILLNKWQCSRSNPQPEKVQFLFNTKEYNAFRFILANFGNCKNSIPKRSRFALSHLRYVKMNTQK